MRRRRVLVLAALGAVLVGMGVVCAQEGPSPTTTTPPPGPAIPVPELVQRAEEALAELRAIDRELGRTAGVLEIEVGFPAERRRITSLTQETVALLDRDPPLVVLEELAGPWSAIESRLSQWAATLKRHATSLEAALGRLDGIRATWEATRIEAAQAEVPAELLKRIDGVLAAVSTTRGHVAERRRVTLVMQERVGTEVERIAALRARVEGLRRRSVGGLFTRTGQPLLGLAAESDGQAWERIWAFARADLPGWGELARHLGVRRGVWIALFAVLALVLVRLRRRARAWRAEDPSVTSAMLPFETPYSVAVLVVVWLASDQWWSEARLVRTVVGFCAMVPMVRVLRPLLPPALRFGPWVMVGVFVLDRARTLSFEVPVVERWLLVAEFALAGVALALATHRAHRDETARTTRWAALLRILGPLAIAMVLVGMATTMSGHLRFAQVAQVGLLRSVNLAALLFGLVRIAEAFVVGLLRMRPLRLLHGVRRNRPSLQAGVNRALAWMGFFTWIVVVLAQLGLLGPARELFATVFTARYERGAIAVSLGDVVAFAITVGLTIVLSRLLRALLRDDVFPRMALSRGLPDTLSRLVHYAIVSVGFLVALASAGIALDRIFVLAGALGVGIGFGLQQVVNNFVCGLILLFERPVRVGDTVEVGGVAGTVRRIGIRSSTVRTWGGAEVIVPNADLVANQVTNWTLSDMLRRLEVPVGVAYGTSPQQVLGILREKALAQDGVVADPAPMALFLGFGESSLDFELRAWTDRFDDWAAVRSQLVLSVHDALAEAGITIPFPQRDLHLRTVEPAVAERLGRG